MMPGGRRSSRARARSKPALLKPKRLMTAASSCNRNSRGRALPDWGRGVSVPTSTKPKPSLSIAPGTSAFLSKPAASPSGLGNFRPRTSTERRGSEEAAFAGGAIFKALIAARWAVSGGSRFRTRPATLANLTRQGSRKHGRRPLPAAAGATRPRRSSAGRRKDEGRALRPRDGSQRKSSPSAFASTAARVKSPRPANHLAAVSGACSAVEKWMKPSARSTDAPLKDAGRLGLGPFLSWRRSYRQPFSTGVAKARRASRSTGPAIGETSPP